MALWSYGPSATRSHCRRCTASPRVSHGDARGEAVQTPVNGPPGDQRLADPACVPAYLHQKCRLLPLAPPPPFKDPFCRKKWLTLVPVTSLPIRTIRSIGHAVYAFLRCGMVGNATGVERNADLLEPPSTVLSGQRHARVRARALAGAQTRASARAHVNRRLLTARRGRGSGELTSLCYIIAWSSLKESIAPDSETAVPHPGL